MATVCTNDDFNVGDDGSLEVAICGDPASAAPCAGFDVDDQALHRGPCGLYVHRARSVENRIAANAPGRQQTPNRLLGPGQQFEASTAATDWVFDNPSPCCPATVIAYVNHIVRVRAEADTFFSIASVTSRNAAQQNVVAISAQGGDDPGDGTRTFDYKITDAVTFTLPAGATGVSLFTSVLVRNSSNSNPGGEVRFVSVTHDGFGVVTVDQC